MSEQGRPEPTQPITPAPPYQPYQQPTFEQPTWETPGPTFSPPPPPQPYADPVYGQPVYGQPAHGQPAPVPYGQPLPGVYGQPGPGFYGQPAYGGSYLVEHPSTATALALGIASMVGLVFCQLLLVLGPFAWYSGAKARRAIDREPQRYTGRSKATTGMVLGIVSTVLLVLGIAAFVLIIVLASTGSSSGTNV